MAAIATLPQPVVVNCTGLGARDLCSDVELVPIKGQLTFLLPQPEINYIVLAGDLYMFPRTDGIVLGGTHVRGDWSLEPDLTAKTRVLTGHAKLFGAL
jgi:D-amino-acid oxidase